MEAIYYVKVGERVQGPFSDAQLKKFAKAGKLTPKAQIRKGKQGAWYPASKVKGLFEGGAAGTKPKPRRPVRRPRAEDEVEFVDDFEEVDPWDEPDLEDAYEDYDEYEDYPPRRSRGRSRKGSGGSWDRANIGVLFATIGMCILTASFALTFFVEFLIEVGAIITISSSPSARSVFDDLRESRREAGESLAEYSARMEERHRERREQLEAWRDSRETALSMFKTSANFYKVTQVVGCFGAIFAVIAYIFCSMAPNRNNAQVLGICAASIAGISLVMRIMFRAIPVFKESTSGFGVSRMPVYDHALLIAGAWRGSGVDVSDKLMCLLVDALIVGELILLCLFLAAALKALKRRSMAKDAMTTTILFAAYGGALLFVYMFMFIEFSRGTKWPTYIVWVLGWGVNVVLAIGMIRLLKLLFQARHEIR